MRNYLPFLVISLLAAACGSSASTTGSGTGGHSSGTGGTGGTGTSTSATTSNTSTTGTGGGVNGACHSQADCVGEFCAVTNLPLFCGSQCQGKGGDGCQQDADCADAGTGLICDKPCVCQGGGAQPQDRCTQGCASDAECGPSSTCTATHRCVASACSAASPCTMNFTCMAGVCSPRPCAKDADCAGFCVNATCSPTLGACEAPVP